MKLNRGLLCVCVCVSLNMMLGLVGHEGGVTCLWLASVLSVISDGHSSSRSPLIT